MRIPSKLNEIADVIIAAGGHPFIVGGSVRDHLMGIEPKDFDIEVFKLNLKELSFILEKFGKPNMVGQAFGIINLRVGGESFDFSIPRRENRVGVGHRDFLIECDPSMTFKDAAARRDFTINAIGFDLISKEIVDPFDGACDIEQKFLVPTSEAFKEDALRVLRGMQFASRFDMLESFEFDNMALEMRPDFKALPKERLWGEWEKWALKGVKPSAGLFLLQECGWLWCFPQLAALDEIEQDPIWHPEGDAFTHTALVCDAAADIANREGLNDFERSILMFAALCHDFGKAECTVFFNNRWR